MRQHSFPPGYSQSDPKALAEAIVTAIESGKASRITREPRWKQNRAFYYNEPQGRSNPPFAGASNNHWNLVQVKLDTLGTHVVGTIFSQEPYCVAESYTDVDVAESLEKIVQFFAKSSKLEEAAKVVSPIAGWSNHGVIKVRWDHRAKPIPRFRFEVREPFSFVVYPAGLPCLEDALLVGDRFYRTKGEIEAMRQNGDYLPGKELEGVDDADKSAFESIPEYGGPPNHSAVDIPSEIVELWDIFYKVQGDWWSITVAPTDRAILRCERWEYDCLPYAEFGYKSKSPEDGHWSAGSVGQDLQGPQLDVNELINLFNDGLRFNFSGLVTAESASWPEKFLTYSPGSIVQGVFRGLQYHSPKADLSPILPLLEATLQNADSIARVSPAAAGASMPGSRTATEASIIGAGQRAGIDEYISTFGSGIETIFKIMQAMLLKSLPDWVDQVGPFLNLSPEDIQALSAPCNWNLNAASIGVTPAAQMQTAMMLVDLALKAPDAGIKQRELGKRILDYAERQGFTNADGLQSDPDPLAIMEELAQALGVDPVAIAEVIDVAIESGAIGVAQGPADVGGSGVPQIPAQGVPGPVGSGIPF